MGKISQWITGELRDDICIKGDTFISIEKTGNSSRFSTVGIRICDIVVFSTVDPTIRKEFLDCTATEITSEHFYILRDFAHDVNPNGGEWINLLGNLQNDIAMPRYRSSIDEVIKNRSIGYSAPCYGYQVMFFAYVLGVVQYILRHYGLTIEPVDLIHNSRFCSGFQQCAITEYLRDNLTGDYDVKGGWLLVTDPIDSIMLKLDAQYDSIIE